MKRIKDSHTFMFIVNIQAYKHQIKQAVLKLYGLGWPRSTLVLVKSDGIKRRIWS
jgi:ribosomal protein L23